MSADEQLTECDVVVLGLGPGGEYAAGELAKVGLRVVGVDERLVGGECPYFGCIPTKMMVAEADRVRTAGRYDGEPADVTRAAWRTVARRIRDEATDDWDDRVAVDRLERAGATFARGHGRLVAPRTVEVASSNGAVTRFVASKGVVLNTGTTPGVPPISGLAGTPYWTNRDVVRLSELPESIVIIGGGAIGCELAHVLSAFGVGVTIIEGADRLIAAEEPEASAALRTAFEHAGITVLTDTRATGVDHDETGFHVDIGDRTLSAGALLVAAGRRNNLSDIGLETVGLDPTTLVLHPDERMRVGDGLWAIGDITGKGGFTHVSMYQADLVIRDLTGMDGPWADYRAVGRVTFAAPEIGSVGMTESTAREAGIPVRTAMGDLGTRGWIAQDPGLIKLVADTERGILIGGTVVGTVGGEVLSLIVTAVHAEIPLTTLANMHYAYPTFHRALQPVIRALL